MGWLLTAKSELNAWPAEGATAHVSPVDLAGHSPYYAALFRQRDFRPVNIASLPVTAPVTQAQLHQIVQALYSKQLKLDMESAEPILRAAHLLDLRCIIAAAELYIAEHFIPAAAVEVHCSLSRTTYCCWTSQTRGSFRTQCSCNISCGRSTQHACPNVLQNRLLVCLKL